MNIYIYITYYTIKFINEVNNNLSPKKGSKYLG